MTPGGAPCQTNRTVTDSNASSRRIVNRNPPASPGSG